MASLAACRTAVKDLGERLSGADDDVRAHVEDRTLSCRISDLDVVLSGRLSKGALVDVTTKLSTEPAQIRLTVSSDDLVDLVEGRLSFPHAWATGRLKLNASIRDVFKLRTLLS
jgi:SCP-2 sterol transfer family